MIFCKDCKHYDKYNSSLCLLLKTFHPIHGEIADYRTGELKNKDFDCKDFNPRFWYRIKKWFKRK